MIQWVIVVKTDYLIYTTTQTVHQAISAIGNSGCEWYLAQCKKNAPRSLFETTFSGCIRIVIAIFDSTIEK